MSGGLGPPVVDGEAAGIEKRGAHHAEGKAQSATFPTFEAMAYVAGDGVPEFLTKSVYRAHGYLPPFEELPSQDEYEAAEGEKRDIEADEAADVAFPLHQFEFLSIAIGRFNWKATPGRTSLRIAGSD